LGFTPDESRRGLLAMRLNLGNRPMAQLESLARKFQDMLYDAAVRAVEGGVYNREVFKTRIEPNRYSYATWATIEGLEHNPYIPAGVRQQAGTLSDIANPFTAATMKLMALERVIQYNKMKRAVIEMLHRDFGEAARAPVSYVAPGRFAPKPAPDGKVLVSFLVDGRPSYWYVDPMIERIFEGVTPAHANAALQALSIGFQKILYPMWISYNPAFLFAKNPVRDFRRTARNLGALTNRPVRAYFDLAREYRAHWSTSVARLRGEVPPLIANMLDNFAIGSPFDSFVGNAYQSKNVFDELMKQYSLAPEVDQSRFRNNKFIAPVARFLKGMQFYGQVFEALPKIAGFKILTEDLGWHPRAAAYLVRNFIGTPNYMKKGQNVALNGTLLPFYNIFLQGLQTDLQLATGRAILPGPQGGKRGQAGTMGDTPPKTAGAWWLSWAIGGGLFTILKAAGKNGLLGERIEKILDGQSDYTLSNYDVVPIGEIPGGEFGSKSVALRVPMDETQRIVNGMLYMMLNGLLERDPDQRQPAWEQFTSLVKYGGGQVPGLNPLLDIPHKWQLYLAGENPMDYYYGRPILTNDEHLRGGWDATVGMLKWTADQSGIRSFVRFNTQADTTLEGAIERTPIVNSLISISDYGYRQQQERPGERRQRQRARLRRTLPEAVRTNLSEYWQVVAVPAEDRTTEQWTKYYRLNTWYHSAYRPTWEAMLEHLEQGDFEDARRAGQYIPAE